MINNGFANGWKYTNGQFAFDSNQTYNWSRLRRSSNITEPGSREHLIYHLRDYHLDIWTFRDLSFGHLRRGFSAKGINRWRKW